MSARPFDLYAAAVCPHELGARDTARAAYETLVGRFLAGAPDVTEADCLAAKDLVDRAEQHARAVVRALGSPEHDTPPSGPAPRPVLDASTPDGPGA